MPIFAPFGFLEKDLVVGFDADAQAFIDAAGITNATQQDAINGLVVDLKGAGIWTKIDAIYPFVGGTATTHKYNLKDPQDTDGAFRIDFVNGATHDSDGVLFNGSTQYGDTHINASTDIGQNSNHMFVSYHTTSADGGLDIGVQSAGASPVCWHLNSRNATNVFNTRNMSSVLNSDSPFTATSGVFGMSRTISTEYNKYFNKTRYLKTVSTGTVDSLNVYIGAQNNAGTAGNHNPRGFNLISMGSGLSIAEWEDFVDINTTYQTALSR